MHGTTCTSLIYTGRIEVLCDLRVEVNVETLKQVDLPTALRWHIKFTPLPRNMRPTQCTGRGQARVRALSKRLQVKLINAW